MKVIFMGTPEFAVPTLEMLSKEGYTIPLVVTQPDKPKGRGKKLAPTPVKEKALELGLEVYQPKNINGDDSIAKLEGLHPDFIVVVAFGQILREKVLELPPYGCINVHASLLPKYRGAGPINWVIINGEEKTGITTMLMDKGLDTGDMLLKEALEIEEEDTLETLHNKLMNMGGRVLIKTLKGLEDGLLLGKPQDHDHSSYAPMLTKNTGKIDWHKTPQQIKNLIRGTNPWPGAYMLYKDSKVKVFKVEIDKCYSKDENYGRVMDVTDEGIYVQAKDGCIIIKELQFPGKKKMEIREYLKGNSFEKDIYLK